MNHTTEPTIDELRANILTEFKQVQKLAPADYTENCTNVVMSLVEEYVSDQVAKARIDEVSNALSLTSMDELKARYAELNKEATQ